MATAQDKERPEEMSPELRDSQEYAYLIAKYGSDPEFMADLARAWRLGFTRRGMLVKTTDMMMTVNPFWL